MNFGLSRESISAAQQRLLSKHGRFLRETPLMKLPGAAIGVPCKEVLLKLEQLQVSGSFKARGMLNRMTSQPIPKTGVIVASGGNAGIATAAAAQYLGVSCEVFLPAVAGAAKRLKLADLGATVTIAGEVYADALAACLKRQQETGALLTHAYDQPEVVEGAGTLGAELEAQCGGRGQLPDHLLVSVGGGGLIAGLASWFEDRCNIHALEPELAPTLHSARAAGVPVDVTVSGIAADSLGAKRIGEISWHVTQRWVKHSHLLTDSAIAAAQRELWQSFRLAVEPAAALPLAALRTNAIRLGRQDTVCMVICGANVEIGT